MADWRYRLKCGARLRRAIESGDHEAVIEGIKAAYKELLDNGLIDDYDYEDYTEDLDMYGDTDDYDDLDEALDYELNDLYDLCDNIRVWISL